MHPQTLSTGSTFSNSKDLEDVAASDFYTGSTNIRQNQPGSSFRNDDRTLQTTEFAMGTRVIGGLGVITVSYIVLEKGFKTSPASSALLSGLVGTAYYIGMDTSTVIGWFHSQFSST